MVKPLCVVPFVHIPQHLKFLPNAPSQLMVASQSGQFQVLDVSNVSQRDAYGYHIDTRGGFVTALDVSSSGERHMWFVFYK
ncbi:hypothetical protein SARC_04221 [Sphaeroforma arctica JP610]|uniref:Uncharacterized protein n=1 Tax=Sphaeroforma arctica JP610 TaxID=667725 RepID=A0A0L0G309_9EUKA|nr:hypothetical protein SARC_04221 [Sphaeroforma arctica JP610]KNC83517.1 hypothetical protein SARC_04221 [Sphaeroforma arctica JP610]|eukprot:XP_014157419.1 hypothetical protein SARC_04221 [Sphaeroforma arctica JP610]